MSGLRRARPGDGRSIGAVEVETWQATYPGMLADRVLLGMSPAAHGCRWERQLANGPEGVWVWEGDGGVQGFVYGGPQRNRALEYDAEIYELYVHPDAQGRGIGRRLIRAAFAEFVRAGRRSALVWVLEGNPARFFYQRLGARPVLRKEIVMGRQAVDTLGYGWNDLSRL